MKIPYKDFLEKSKKNTPQVLFDYFYRKISFPLSYIFVRLNITPNQIGASQSIIYIFGAYQIFQQKPVSGLLIFIAAYILDFCDGNVARIVSHFGSIERTTLRRGLMLENFNTNLSLFLMYISLGWYFSLVQGDNYFLLIAFSIFSLRIIMRYTDLHLFLYKMKVEKEGGDEKASEKKKTSPIINKIKFYISKSIFSANVYYASYLIVFIFFPAHAFIFFLIYSLLDFLTAVLKIFDIFYRKCKF